MGNIIAKRGPDKLIKQEQIKAHTFKHVYQFIRAIMVYIIFLMQGISSISSSSAQTLPVINNIPEITLQSATAGYITITVM